MPISLLIDSVRKPFLLDVIAWAEPRGDVQLVLVVGSQARRDTPADAWSDVDLALVVDDPERYLSDPSWLHSFGVPLLTFVEPTAVGGAFERRALFRDGLEVDFSFLSRATVDGLTADPASAEVLARGFHVLVDKVGLTPLLEAVAASRSSRSPNAAAFSQLSHDFWYHVLWGLKKLARGEIWLARCVCDGYLKERLVTLIAWHARGSTPEIDTWHGGRFLEGWADPALVDDLWATTLRGRDDVGRAFIRTAQLFSRLEISMANRVGLASPVDHEAVWQRVRALAREIDPSLAELAA